MRTVDNDSIFSVQRQTLNLLTKINLNIISFKGAALTTRISGEVSDQYTKQLYALYSCDTSADGIVDLLCYHNILTLLS